MKDQLSPIYSVLRNIIICIAEKYLILCVSCSLWAGYTIWRKKSRIQETKHFSTDADSSTDTKKPNSKAKFAKKKKKKQKF